MFKADRAIHLQVSIMTIGSAVQRGQLVYVYDEKGRRLTSLLAGQGPKDRLQGYTSSTVSVRRGSLIYTYDERGRRLSSTLAGR
jgi:YD repeat-containing protein